jgi:5-methylcytosine-specific restriction endonuclease McrA
LLELTREQIGAAAGRRYAPGYLRAYILERDGFKCVYCKSPLTNETANIDHKKAWPWGLTVPENLVACCRICNAAKGRGRHRKLSKADKRMIKIALNPRSTPP